jgi:DNA modification methylase
MVKARSRKAAKRKDSAPVPANAQRVRRLFYGDNLEVLRGGEIASGSVDLVYLDPPFKSNQEYNVLFRDRAGERSAAQMRAFEDTWIWGDDSEAAFQETLALGGDISDAMIALRHILQQSDMMAYVAMMAPRLVELRRVLKTTGSLYLHCDPTASHYLKILLDAVFRPENFRNEIIWKRTTAHSSAKKYAPVHDVLLYYGKSDSVFWNSPRTDYDQAYLDKYYRFDDGDGRLYWRADLCAAGVRNGESGKQWRGFDVTAKGMHWKFAVGTLDQLDAEGRIYWPKGGTGWPQYKRYRDELKGKAVSDLWDDIDRINPVGGERLGYPTQKPEALLERIIQASSNEGDVVLDPFCGCGTTIAAAENLKRGWIGIDVAFLAVDLIEKRLRHTYGEEFRGCYSRHGIPKDVEGARALFEQNPLDFQVWAVSMVDGQPNEKKSGDRGIDGRVLFPIGDKLRVGSAVVSVKGGHVGPAAVRELVGTMKSESADMALLIVQGNPTRGMVDAAHAGGLYTWPPTQRAFPKVQVISVLDLLEGKRPNMPQALLPYVKAKPAKGKQLDLELGAPEPVKVKADFQAAPGGFLDQRFKKKGSGSP